MDVPSGNQSLLAGKSSINVVFSSVTIDSQRVHPEKPPVKSHHFKLGYAIRNHLVGGWPTPLKNDGLRQLGWWHSQLNEKIKAMFQTTNQINMVGIYMTNH